MLVITRKLGERLLIGDDIVVTVLEVNGQRVRLGIDAPASVPLLRGELPEPCPKRMVAHWISCIRREKGLDRRILSFAPTRRVSQGSLADASGRCRRVKDSAVLFKFPRPSPP